MDNNNDIVDAMSKEAQNLGVTDSGTTTQKAWDLAKQQAGQKYNDTDPEYYPYVTELTRQIMNQTVGEKKQQMNPNQQKPSMFSNPGENSNYTPKQTAMESTMKEEIKDLEYFDWKVKSNTMVASVRFLIEEALYQMDFTHAKEGNSQWNSRLSLLSKKGINSVLLVSIDQLNGDPTIQRISSSENPITNKEKLNKVMNKAFEEYFADYNKMNLFQYVIFTASNIPRLQFLLQYADCFTKKYTKFELFIEIGNELKQSGNYYVALKNTTAKLKEDEGGDTGTVMASSFGDEIPSDAGRTKKDWKKDWEQQKESKKRVILRRFVDLSSVDK